MKINLNVFLSISLILVNFSAIARGTADEMIKINDLKLDYSLTDDQKVQNNKLYYYTKTFTADKFKKLKTMPLLDTQDILNKKNPHEVIAVKAFFIIDKPQGNLDFSNLNNKKSLQKVYSSNLKSTQKNNLYRMSKNLIIKSLHYNLEANLYKIDDKMDDHQQTLLATTLEMDNLNERHLISLIHQQDKFSSIFERGDMIANIYSIKRGGSEKLLISIYSLTYPRVSALKKIDKFLFFSTTNARKKLTDVILDKIINVFDVSTQLL
ncbi:MAG: hypothetical protein HON90_04170 [Halobacteriovoraceae bacterium]|jgi:hypothetical protein|nr:hypothetical protein [Halobacteriovoraceae bacterium]